MSVDTTTYYPPLDKIELLDIDSATSEATGYPKEHLLDGSLKTAWKPTTTGDQEIIIDRNQLALPSAVYAFGFFIRNYTTDHSNGGTAKFKVYHSTTSGSWGTAIIDQAISAAAVPCRIHETAELALNRYIRITFTTLNTTLEISRLFLAEKQAITQGPELPYDVDNAFLNIHQGDGAEDYPVTPKNYLPVAKATRKYTMVTAVKYAALYAAFNRAGGGRHMIVVVDSLSGSAGSPYVAKIKDLLSDHLKDHDLYDMTVTLQAQAYIQPALGY